MTEWKWVASSVVFAVHDRQLAQHGGLDGIRDTGALDSALARPKNLAAYETPDLADLAAAYAFGLARNHPFSDGNKRTAWVIARLFLIDNGGKLLFDQPAAIRLVQTLAAGEIGETEVAAWFRVRLRSND